MKVPKGESVTSSDHQDQNGLFHGESEITPYEDKELGVFQIGEEEKQRLKKIIGRILEICLLLLATVSIILCICLLCLLKFC